MIGLPPGRLQTHPSASPASGIGPTSLPREWGLAGVAAFLTLGPVFLQAPLVRVAPMAATLLSVPLLLLALTLSRRPEENQQRLGVLLVGFTGSWLGGSLFWGWFRDYPLWHLPIEGFALPLALGGLNTRWRLGASFYLASLLGTAVTDGLIATTGLMPLWPLVVQAPQAEAGPLLQNAALGLLRPFPLLAMGLAGWWIVLLTRLLWPGDGARRVAAATLASTLAVDGLFLLAALLAPRLSGLI